MSTYLFETHMHTAESSPCGKIGAREITRMYKKAGYRGIIITDHYSEGAFRRTPDLRGRRLIDHFLQGYRTARDEGERIGIAVLFGIELTFSGSTDDFLVYGPDEEFLYSTPDLMHLGLERFRESSGNGEAGIVIFQAHPFRAVCTPASSSLIDGIEVFNGNPRQESNNWKAERFARRNGLIEIAGSDAHQPEDVARAGVFFDRIPRNNSELARMLTNEYEDATYIASGDPDCISQSAGW